MDIVGIVIAVYAIDPFSLLIEFVITQLIADIHGDENETGKPDRQSPDIDQRIIKVHPEYA